MRKLHGRSQLSLLFVVQSKHWRLPPTLLRVISSYLSLPSQLLYINQRSQVLLFDPETQQWTKAFAYPPIREFEVWKAAVVSAREIVVVVVDPWNVLYTYLLSQEQSIWQADFYPYRTDFGLVYSSVRDTVYLFGGLRAGLIETSSGALVLNDKEWDYLPNLTIPRYAFNPVLYGPLIYLCGGGGATIETFHPYSRTYTLIPSISLPPDPRDQWETACTVGNSALIILSGRSISLFNPTASTIQHKQIAGLSGRWHSAYSCSAPVVVGNRVYVVDCLMPVVCKINLASGSLEAEIRA